MKNIMTFTILLLLLARCPIAHSECSINMAVIPLKQSETLSIQAQNLLDAKLRHILTTYSISVESEHITPFFITGQLDNVNPQHLAGPPMRTATHITLTLYIGNHLTQTIYSSLNIELRGVGNNISDAIQNTIVSIKPTSQQFKEFIESSKKRILEYYDNNLHSIIQQAQKAATLHDYQQSICLLASVPSCCRNYDSVLPLIDSYYSQYINSEGKRLLQQALGEWASSHSLENATKCINLLTQINPESSAHTKALKLICEIDSALESNSNYVKHELTDKIIDLEKYRLNVISKIFQTRSKSFNNHPNVSITWIN